MTGHLGRRTAITVLLGLVLVLPARPAARGQERKPPCEYIADILAVSLPDQAGQPAEIEVTSSDFATYERNLGLDPDFASAYAGKRVLDVGAGLSEFVDIMADDYGADAVAVDVAYAEIDLRDLSPACVELFYRRRLAMDAQRLLFPSNFFDLVVSHSLLKWFFLFAPEEGEDARLRIRRGMDILGQMVRVANAGGEIRTTDFPDPNGEWFAQQHPELVDAYRAAYREFLRPYTDADELKLEIEFCYRGDRGYTVIRKLERVPRVDIRSPVSVIRAQGRPPTRPPRQ